MPLVHAWVRQALLAVRTIRWRLTLWSVALLALIVLAFSGFLYISLSRTLESQLDQSLLTDTQQVAATLVFAGGAGFGGLGDGPDTLPPGVVVVLYDASGTRVIASNLRQVPPVPTVLLASAMQGQAAFATLPQPDGSRWRARATPITAGGHLLGVLEVARSADEMQQALEQLVLLMAIAIPAVLLLATAGGLFLAGRALTPIDRVTRLAATMGADDLSRRLRLRGDDEVGRLAATFDSMLDRLEAAFQRQRQFTADASHELRTPLALLRGQIDVALERTRSPADYARILHSLREDSERLGQLLSELLTLARADAGQESLTLEVVDLDELAGQVVEAMQPLAQGRDLQLAFAPGASTPVWGDQTRLTQLLINLVDNALKYTPAGGRVSVLVDNVSNSVRMRVQDSGVGIAPEHLPHLFERFYRADSARTREQGGAGLGLAICRWIVQAHGGQITVESTPGAGTTVSVTLPQPATPAATANPLAKQVATPV